MNPVSTGVQQLPFPPLSLRPHHTTNKSPSLSRHRIIPFPFIKLPPRPVATRSSAVPPPIPHIEMHRSPDGSWSARESNIVILWDLDNKPPRGPPYLAAMSLRRLAHTFGRVLEISAYANRHAFLHLPQWVREDRRDRRQLDALERKGIVVPNDPYVCGVCGRKCATGPELKRHFRQLHEREREKKLARMRSLKGKRRENYKKRFVSGNEKYAEAAREILTPKRGYGLASELRRAGVFVKMVEDKPQAADSAVKRQMRHSMSRGIDFLFLVSDDGDFSEMIRKAREADLKTVVIGDGRKSLGRLADYWVSWTRVEKGEVGEEVLLSGRNSLFQEGDVEEDVEEVLFYSNDDDDDDDFANLDRLVDDVVVERFEFGGSAFSEEEMWDGENVRRKFGNGVSGVVGESGDGVSLSWTIEDEDDCYI